MTSWYIIHSMHLTSTPLPGVYVVEPLLKEDERGFFGRTWDAAIAKKHGLQERFEYSCISGNRDALTLRGMHWQKAPHGEVKLIRCTKGKVFDVALDLRKDSPTFKQWFGVELSAENRKGLYLPKDYAHGFLTLEPDTEILYCLAGEYKPDAAEGVRWNDPAFGVAWPAEPKILAERDATFPDFLA